LASVFVFAGIAALVSIDSTTTTKFGGSRPASANNHLFTKDDCRSLYIFDSVSFHCSFQGVDLKKPPRNPKRPFISKQSRRRLFGNLLPARANSHY
jgi:hypothetical protein